MRGITFLTVAAVVAIGFTATPKAEAQVSVDIGVAPECPYGYYDVAPYACAPTGYYGPEWFHGSSDFQGNVNNRLHPEHGYKGPSPKRGEKAEPAKRVDTAHFHGNEARDGRGHVSEGKR